jgi:hypothetical protein
MIAWIIGIVFLLIISLCISNEYIEPFQYNPPTVVPTKIRSDLTCSDPNSSAIIDRFDKKGLELLGSNLPFPPAIRNNDLGGAEYSFPFIYIQYQAIREKLREVCTGGENGSKIFFEKNVNALDGNYKLVDVYCCKGELYQPPGTNNYNDRVCLAACPSNYTTSVTDNTICIRNDNYCSNTADLSANIQNNWSKACSALYKQNVNILSTMNSISSVVSTFSIQTSSIQSNYIDLNRELTSYVTTYRGTSDNNKISKINNYDINFTSLTDNYCNLYSNIQSNISERYNILKADKVKFDTLFNNLGCSNFM